MLYVEADNIPAIRIYEDIGFTHFSTIEPIEIVFKYISISTMCIWT
ncbi:MAG: hypothetical protein CM15mP49_01750 [Actinomycetota bacterium]|nr:MAG: hypothetical protein CM15mP49_01750 [Actinomycetota bacterium]